MIDFVELDLIVFHDLPLNKINIQLDATPKLELEISVFDDDMNGYLEKTLVFGDLKHLNPRSVDIDDYSDSEILSFDYRLEGGLFFGKINCLTGFGKPSIELDFSCEKVEVKERNKEDNKT